MIPENSTPRQWKFSDSHSVRTTLDDAGEPWFVATDVAVILEYRDAYNAVRGLDDDELGTHLVSTPGGNQTITTVNESGLFALILRSDKPQARTFRKWVTSVLLPSLRRRQGFACAPLPETIPEDPQEAFGLWAALDDQREALRERLKLIRRLQKTALTTAKAGAPPWRPDYQQLDLPLADDCYQAAA